MFESGQQSGSLPGCCIGGGYWFQNLTLLRERVLSSLDERFNVWRNRFGSGDRKRMSEMRIRGWKKQKRKDESGSVAFTKPSVS